MRLHDKVQRNIWIHRTERVSSNTYHETKSHFAWVGEISNEQLASALEKMSDEDLELLTLYAYEGYSVVESSKVYHVVHQNISK